VCCYENFCDKHIKEEIMKNFTCPNCKVSATMRDIIQNKKLRELIQWYKNLLTAQPLQIIVPASINNTNYNNSTAINNNNNLNIQANQNPPKMLLSNMLNHANLHNFGHSGGNISNISTMQNNYQFNPMNYPGMQNMHNYQMQQMMNTVNKVDSLDNFVDNNEGDMTTEEKMQLYNKINEADVTRKQSEDKGDDNKSISENGTPPGNKSVKDNKDLQTDKQILIPPIVYPTHPMPHLPYLPGMNPNYPIINPMMNPLAGVNPGIKIDPSMLPFRGGYDPRMMHHMTMMQQAYGYPQGMPPKYGYYSSYGCCSF
jgi:hypothetical protein